MCVAWGGKTPPPPAVWLLKIFPKDGTPHYHEDSSQKRTQNTPVTDDAPLRHVWLQKIQNFTRYGRNNHFFWVSSRNVTLTLKIGTPNISHDTPRPWGCTNIPSFIKKIRVVHKILSGTIFPEDLNTTWPWPQSHNVTLTSRTAFTNCDITLWQVIVYHYTKSLWKRFRSSGDTEETLWPWPSNNTPGHDDAQPCQVSWRKIKWFRRYRPDKYSRIWTLTVTLTLKTAI